MSTPTAEYSAPNFKSRIEALDMKYLASDSADPEKFDEDIKEAFENSKEA